MTRILLFFSALLLAAIATVSCSGEEKKEQEVAAENRLLLTQEEIDQIHEEDSLVERAIAFTESEFDGMKLFMMHCNKCHPGGEAGEGPSLIKKDLPDFLIHFQVRAGLGDMPSFDKNKLSKEEVKTIILFIHQLRDYSEGEQ